MQRVCNLQNGMADVRIDSALARRLGVQHPVFLAGMAVVSGPALAAAVTNAGGLGVVGAGFPNPSPERLRKMLDELRGLLDDDKKTLFGVDLLIPQVGGSARATNYDYTRGRLPEMVDVICESGCRMLVVAVGTPPPWMVERLHKSGVLIMNMVGSPRHVVRSLDAGVDTVCAQGYEGGGHTGAVATMSLLPRVVTLCRGRVSRLTGEPVRVVAAGGICSGETMAAALALGADAVWVGTRFLASHEATATELHKSTLLKADSDDTVRSEIYTGRPARVYRTPYVTDWHSRRRDELAALLAKGVVPYAIDLDRAAASADDDGSSGGSGDANKWSMADTIGLSFSQSAGSIDEILPAAEIVARLVRGCADALRGAAGRVHGAVPTSRL